MKFDEGFNKLLIKLTFLCAFLDLWTWTFTGMPWILGPIYTRPVGRQGKWTSNLLQVNCPVWMLTCLNFEARQVAWQAARQGKWVEGSSIFEATCLPPPIPAGNLPFTCLVWTATCRYCTTSRSARIICFGCSSTIWVFKMPARWNDELTCKYVELYKEHECLWNMNSTLYKRKRCKKKCVGRNSEKNGTGELHYRKR
jgi:hypothetical protein